MGRILLIEAPFVHDKHHDQNKAEEAEAEAKNVNQRIAFVLNEAAICSEEVAKDHGRVGLVII